MNNDKIEKNPSCRKINGMFIPQLQVNVESLPIICDPKWVRSANASLTSSLSTSCRGRNTLASRDLQTSLGSNMTRSTSTPNIKNSSNPLGNPLRKPCFSQNFFNEFFRNSKETNSAPLSDRSASSLKNSFDDIPKD